MGPVRPARVALAAVVAVTAAAVVVATAAGAAAAAVAMAEAVKAVVAAMAVAAAAKAVATVAVAAAKVVSAAAARAHVAAAIAAIAAAAAAVAETTAAAVIDRPRQPLERPLRRLFQVRVCYIFNSYSASLTGASGSFYLNFLAPGYRARCPAFATPGPGCRIPGHRPQISPCARERDRTIRAHAFELRPNVQVFAFQRKAAAGPARAHRLRHLAPRGHCQRAALLNRRHCSEPAPDEACVSRPAASTERSRMRSISSVSVSG